MTKKYKSIVAILFIACMYWLSACVKEETAAYKNDEVPNITIRWLIVGERSKSQEGIVAKFNEELQKFFPGTTVEFEIVNEASYKEKWDMIMAANESIDIVWVGSDMFNYTEEVKKGSFMALDYLLTTFGEDLIAEIPEEMWNMQMRDGKIYSVPLKGALYRADYAAVASKSNMEKYGDMERIRTVNQEHLYSDAQCYEVFEEYLENLQLEHKLGTGLSCDTFVKIADKGYEGIYGQASPFVIRIFDEELRVYNKYELESYKAYFRKMHEWYQAGYIREDIEEVLVPNNDNGIPSGNAVFLDEYGESGVVSDEIVTEYEAVRIPLQRYKYISYEMGRNALAIPRTTENPQRAMEIINLLNSQRGAELCKLLANGVEGRHFVQRENNQIDKVVDENGKALHSLSPDIIGNRFLNYENDVMEFKQLEKYNEEAIRSPLIGFELDTRMIVLEMTQVDLIVAKYFGTLKCGTAENWEEEYNDMIREMKSAGADKVIVEIQKQLDVFTE